MIDIMMYILQVMELSLSEVYDLPQIRVICLQTHCNA